jgi:hypothetical protein
MPIYIDPTVIPLSIYTVEMLGPANNKQQPMTTKTHPEQAKVVSKALPESSMDRISKALKAYPDSDLVSLAETLTTIQERAAELHEEQAAKSQEWAMRAADEILAFDHVPFREQLAAIIQRHAPPSMERDLADALRDLLGNDEHIVHHAIAMHCKTCKAEDSARAVLARYDAKGTN